MKELVIVGGGPAGLAAAGYAIRKRIDFVLISDQLGGKTRSEVAFPGIEGHAPIKAKEIVESFCNQVEYLDYIYQHGRVERVDVGTGRIEVELEDGSAIETKAVLVATGTTPRTLGVPGEQSLFGRGLGYSSVSYSHLLADKTAFVLGDTDRVLHAALDLSTRVSMLYLMLEPAGTYHIDLLERLQRYDTIELIEDHDVVEFTGTDWAEHAIIEGESGDRRTIAADAFFLERHPVPNSGIVSTIVDLDPEGHIYVDAGGCTSHEGIYAAGDVTAVGLEQVLSAMGDGTKAVLSAYEYILTDL